MSPCRVSALGYVVWGAREPSTMHRFLVDGLGLQPAAGEDPGAGRARAYRMDARACRWLVVPADSDGLVALGLEVDDVDALGDAADTLAVLGLRVERGADSECRPRAVDALVRVADPAGHAVELFARGREVAEPFVSPVGSAFVTDPIGIGHVVLSAPDLAASERFYVGTLGFRRSDVLSLGSAEVVFLRCNPRHHTVALAGLPGAPRVLHAMVELSTLDAVGHAQDRLTRLGFPLRRTLGRHSNDRMVSFYVHGPAGLQMEVGWGGTRVDDRAWRVGRISTTSLWGHRDVSASERS